MSTTLAAGTATSGAALSSDTSGILVLQSGSTPTTAMTIGTNQVVTFAQGLTPASTSGIIGTTTNDNANTGAVGEFVSSRVLSASRVSLTTSTYTPVTSISLTAGDWDVGGICYFNGSTTTVSALIGSSSTVNNNNGGESSYWIQGFASGGSNLFAVQDFGQTLPPWRYSLSSTTTIYLIAYGVFSSGALYSYGQIRARRIR